MMAELMALKEQLAQQTEENTKEDKTTGEDQWSRFYLFSFLCSLQVECFIVLQDGTISFAEP